MTKIWKNLDLMKGQIQKNQMKIKNKTNFSKKIVKIQI